LPRRPVALDAPADAGIMPARLGSRVENAQAGSRSDDRLLRPSRRAGLQDAHGRTGTSARRAGCHDRCVRPHLVATTHPGALVRWRLDGSGGER